MENRMVNYASLQARASARWENEGGAGRDDLASEPAFGEAAPGVDFTRAQPITPTEGGLREAVAVFDSVEQLQAAVDELLESGFDRAELSLLAAADAVDAKIGNLPPSVIEDDKKAPRGIYVSPEAMNAAEGGIVGTLVYLGGTATAAVIALAGGPITAMVVGGLIAGGAGGLVGSGIAAILGHHRAAYFDEQLARGGLLLWVRTWNAEREERALEVLRRHSGHDAHVHAFGPANISDQTGKPAC